MNFRYIILLIVAINCVVFVIVENVIVELISRWWYKRAEKKHKKKIEDKIEKEDERPRSLISWRKSKVPSELS